MLQNTFVLGKDALWDESLLSHQSSTTAHFGLCFDEHSYSHFTNIISFDPHVYPSTHTKTKDYFLRRCQDLNKNKSCCLPKTKHLQTLGKGHPDVLITVINTMMRLEEDGVDFSLQPSGHISLLREARAGTWGQDQGPLVDNCACWFASHNFLSLFSYTLRDYFARFRTTNNSLGPLTFIKKIINHKSRKCPIGLPTNRSCGTIFFFSQSSVFKNDSN